MSTVTSTTTLTFQANDQSLWGPGAGLSINRLFDNLVFQTSIGPFSGQHTFNLPFGNSAGIDYSLSIPNLEFGFPIQASLSSGVYDLNYPAIANLSLPGTVAAGTSFTVATGFGGVVAPTLAIDGPSAELSVDAILRANVVGRLGLTWNLLGLASGSKYFFGAPGANATIPIDQSYSIFDLNTSGGASLGDLVGWSSTNAAGRTTYFSPVGDISYYLDLNGLDGDGLPRLGADQLTDFSAVLYQTTPMVSLSLDVDDTIGALLGATVAGPLISGLDGEFNDFPLSLNASILSLNTSIGVSLAQRVTFDATALKVTLVSSTGESRTGRLGDSFSFTAPATTGTPLSVTASCALEGTVKVETGLVVTGSVDIHGLGVQGKILGFDVSPLFPDGPGAPDRDSDHFLINYRGVAISHHARRSCGRRTYTSARPGRASKKSYGQGWLRRAAGHHLVLALHRLNCDTSSRADEMHVGI